MSVKSRVIIAVMIVILAISTSCDARITGNKQLINDIERFAANGRKMPGDASEKIMSAIVTYVERKGKAVTPALLEKINSSGISDERLMMYIWAAGFAHDPALADTFIRHYESDASELVKQNALKSLGMTGSDTAGEYLLALAKNAADKNETSDGQPGKFNIINMLAEMQYEKALPEMEYLLKKDFEEYYWQMVFIFGKMGDKATPFLLGKLASPDRNIRMGAVYVFGTAVMDVRAFEPLKQMYAKEQDAEIRRAIIGTMERLIPNAKTGRRIFKEIAQNESDEKLKIFAKDAADGMDKLDDMMKIFRKSKIKDKAAFRREYNQLYQSKGKKGSIRSLGDYSTATNESELKKLARRILTRDSDECLHEFQELNMLIMMNRMAKK